MRTIASVGFSIVGSGTVSTRTSRLPCQATAFMAHLGGRVPSGPPQAPERRNSGGRAGAGGVEQLVAGGELDPRPSARGAALALARVDGPPAVDGDEIAHALAEQGIDVLAVRTLGLGERAGPQVLDQAGDGLLGVALVRAEDPGRPALDPADGVDPGQRLAVGRVDAAALVGKHEAAFLERDAGQRDRAVADRAQDEAARDRLDLVA